MDNYTRTGNAASAKNLSQVNNAPSVFVIMGITGDLAFKKIIPSLWHLYTQDHLGGNLSIIGFARRPLSDDDFAKLIRDSVTTHNNTEINEEKLGLFLERFDYQMGDFSSVGGFEALAKKIKEKESKWGMCSNKLFYLSTPPSAYESIFENVSKAGLNIPCDENANDANIGWSRILVEKPFGLDLESAQKLQTLLSSYFTEEQIYRIDHYLFKEILQGIDVFRFSNNLFERTWDNTTIEKIDLRLLETLGVKKRGSFYDAIGTLRDVGQNHLLVMLAAIIGEAPGTEVLERERRADAISMLAPWTTEKIRSGTERAQYKGYRDIAGVGENSQTETYFSLQTELTGERWGGVSVFMEAGKRMLEARKEIIVTFKDSQDCSSCGADKVCSQNKIAFRFEPNDEIIISFQSKKPGFINEIEEREFSFFLHEKATKIQYVEEYSKIIYDAIRGDQSKFVSAEEVEASWKFTDPIIKAWKDNLVPLRENDAA